MGMLPQSNTTQVQAAQAGNRMTAPVTPQRPDIRMILQRLQQMQGQPGQQQGVPRRVLPQMHNRRPAQMSVMNNGSPTVTPQGQPWTGGGMNMSMFQPAFNQQPGFAPRAQAAMPIAPVALPGQMQDPGTVQIGGITVNKGWFDPDSLIGAGA